MAQRSMASEASPQQVRKKWDALLAVINGGATVEREEGEQGKTPMAARELLEQSIDRSAEMGGAAAASGGAMASFGGAASSSPMGSPTGSDGGSRRRARKPEWNGRHHLLFSVNNGCLQKNVRSYFDRTREVDAYGLRYDAPLKNEWQLDYGTDHTYDAKKAEAEEIQMMESMAQQPSTPSQALLPPVEEMRGMSRSASLPNWDQRHHVLFNKDNHHYHPNYRDYFSKPRDLLW